MEPWNPGTLEPWNPRTLEPWNPGTLEPWNPGTLLRERRPDHDLPDAEPWRPVRDAVGLGRLPFGVAAGSEHSPRFLAGGGVEIAPEVRGDGVVGDIGHHPRPLSVLDLPERVTAE